MRVAVIYRILLALAAWGLLAGAAQAQNYGVRLDATSGLVSGGTGYSAGSVTLDATQSTRPGSCVTSPVLTVAVTSGVITSYTIATPGDCAIIPSNPVHAATGGATFNLKWGSVAASIPNLSASQISGLAAVAGSGSASDLSTGTLPAGRMPALTGDCTTTAGAVATNCTKTGGVAFVASATTDTTNAANISSGILSNSRLSAIPNSALANSSMTLAGHSVSLGGSQAFAAADLTDGNTGTGSIVHATSPTITTPSIAYELNSNTCSSTNTCVAACSSGKKVVGGGALGNSGGGSLADSWPSDNAHWTIFYSPGYTYASITAYAICTGVQ